MKNIIALSIIFVAMQSQAKVLVEKITSVGFAPPGMAGDYKLQLLDSGVVQKVDNKGAIKVVLKLSPESLTKLTKLVRAVKALPLEKQAGPVCMDAPTTQIVVYKSVKTSITTEVVIQCVKETNYDAADINGLINSLQDVSNIL